MLLTKFEESLKYEEIVHIAKSVPYGRIIVNKNNLPILYRHPFINECLILGYKPNSNEISFAQLYNKYLTFKAVEPYTSINPI